MSFSLYDASAPVFVAALTNMRNWLDKAANEGDAEALMRAKLIDDMRPLPAQFQMASDSAKNCLARLLGVAPPAMPDTEATFDELKARCDKTIAYLEGIDPAALAGAEDREVVMSFREGIGYRFSGADYLSKFALPNFYFHVSMAYAILRAQGISLGKPDYLAHLGPPGPV